MSLPDAEYAALRQTIATRGTVRMALVPLVMIGWSLLLTGGTLTGGWHLLVSLLVLAAGFEAVHALHVGVERIGRYLQVFYEDGPEGPRWESTAMRIGPALPGGGIDPLFTLVFFVAVLLNLIPALGVRPTPFTVVAVLAHVAVLVRIVRARRAAARQRAVELESYRAIRARGNATT